MYMGKDETVVEHRIGTREQWLAARAELLEAEKVVIHLGDALTQRRQWLPWVPVDKQYLFDTAEGEKTLGDLFDGRSQLITYHFQFCAARATGYPGCSLMTDSLDHAIAHLNRHDVTMLFASRLPLAELDACKRRMGWSFEWVSTLGNDFGDDFGARFIAEEEVLPDTDDSHMPWCAAERESADMAEVPASLSTFVLEGGIVYHTYSCDGRGLEAFNAAYQLLDRTPRGRNLNQRPASGTQMRQHVRNGEPIKEVTQPHRSVRAL
jgi:predicted dithiol-disulfide oxidoreductase (DUF899 family)